MSRDQISRKYTPLTVSTGGAENVGVENAGAYRRGGKCRSRSQGCKMREQTAGVENSGATKYGKPSEKNSLKYHTKYQLTVDEIRPGFEDVKSMLDVQSPSKTPMQQLLTYVDRQWLNKSTIGPSRLRTRQSVKNQQHCRKLPCWPSLADRSFAS